MKKFEGKKVVVTGATRGIGFAIAKAFLEEGASVTILGRSKENGEKALSLLSPLGEVYFYAVDVSDHKVVKHFSEEWLQKFGTIDVLINNAGISKNTLFLRQTEEVWDSVVDTNLKSVYNMTYAFTRSLLKNKGSRIINISSIAGGVRAGNPGQAHYAASKGAIVSMTKTLAREFGKKGVLVNAIAPGYTETDMIDFLEEEMKAKIEEMVPVQRLGKPEDIAAGALFLASSAASYITGHVLVIDGGLTV
ncbi:glucose 1-dehydrogenase [bacterium]|nr:glucose 1-dehydrogenase [bacterium]